MKKYISILFLIGLVIWGVFDYMSKNANEKEETDAKQEEAVNLAPQFTLKTIDGEEVSLSDYKGKKVIINIFGTWCPPCRAEMPEMQKFYEDNKNEVVILALNQIDTEKNIQVVKQFTEYYALTFPILIDDRGVAATKYKFQYFPTSYFINTKGEVEMKIDGPMDYKMLETIIKKMK